MHHRVQSSWQRGPVVITYGNSIKNLELDHYIRDVQARSTKHEARSTQFTCCSRTYSRFFNCSRLSLTLGRRPTVKTYWWPTARDGRFFMCHGPSCMVSVQWPRDIKAILINAGDVKRVIHQHSDQIIIFAEDDPRAADAQKRRCRPYCIR